MALQPLVNDLFDSPVVDWATLGIPNRRPGRKVRKAAMRRSLWAHTGTVHGSCGRWDPRLGYRRKLTKYDANQRRGNDGRWTTDGGGAQAAEPSRQAPAGSGFSGQARAYQFGGQVPDHWPDDPDAHFEPAPVAAQAADAWRKLHPERTGGLPEADFTKHEVAPQRSVAIGEAYDRIDPEAPVKPEVRKAWEAMGKEVEEQFAFLQAQGIKFEFVDNDPYAGAQEMADDLRQNKRLKVFSTSNQSKALGVSQYHPVLTDEQNDRFRAVHDVLGHAAIGRGFDFNGEDAAYYHHGSMFSPEALRAMATETRGQNSHYAKAQVEGKSADESFDPHQRIGFLPDDLLKRARRQAQILAQLGMYKFNPNHDDVGRFATGPHQGGRKAPQLDERGGGTGTETKRLKAAEKARAKFVGNKRGPEGFQRHLDASWDVRHPIFRQLTIKEKMGLDVNSIGREALIETWNKMEPCKQMRRMAAQLVGHPAKATNAADPFLHEPAMWGGQDPIEYHGIAAFQLLHQLHSIGRKPKELPVNGVMYRMSGIDPKTLQAALKEGDQFDLPLASFAGGMESLTEYGDKVIFRVEHPKAALRGTSLTGVWKEDADWRQSKNDFGEFLSGGRFKVTSMKQATIPGITKKGKKALVIDLEHIGVFNPWTGAVE